MTKTEIFVKKSSLYSALVLENFFSGKKRRWVMRVTKYLIISIPVVIILSIIFGGQDITNTGELGNVLIRKLIGLISISLGLYVLMRMFEAYFSSIYYFEYIAQNNYSGKELYTFSAGRILRRVERDNLLTGLLRSQGLGRKIISRLGITREEADNLLMKQSEVKNPPIFKAEGIPLVKVSHLLNFIYANYADFRSLLANHGLGQKDLEATTAWVIYDTETKEYKRQWWTREKLSQIPGVAADWSFGRTYLLNKYSRNLLQDDEVNSEAITLSGRTRELEQVQAILSRGTGANVMLIGLPGQEKMEVIWNLCRKLKDKTAAPMLIGQRPVLFLTEDFIRSTKDKIDFEEKLVIIFREAMAAGNIILVIDNFPKLILSAKQYELNLYEMIEPYLVSIDDQIIALADTEYFHTLIENDQALMSRFEVVQTKPLLLEEVVKIIAREALAAEKEYEITYTFPAILEIAKDAEYYFPDGVSGDKAKDLLSELSPWAVKNGFEIIDKEEVLKYVSGKTDIPIGSITTDERDKLLNLESLLMKRVVSQREAVFAVANAIRRNRAGIRDEKRPLGSFLFLGPTGVGKTETAKALAEILFGQPGQSNEKLLLRLDMSEYQNQESLARLIGSLENQTQGILSNMLREHPYGVLLLDEFEKTNKDVLNLFLQIIDEGYFSDAFGKKVVARNILFIATSNAGSEKIFELVSAGKSLKESETEIISYIIKQGDFKPELINRFDATILFHPLTKENLAEIAEMMLEKIVKLTGNKGITFVINKELINFLAQGGYNPTFGARPMNRLIQDTVEGHLSDLIIRNELTAGQTVEFSVIGKTFTKEDLEPKVR